MFTEKKKKSIVHEFLHLSKPFRPVETRIFYNTLDTYISEIYIFSILLLQFLSLIFFALYKRKKITDFHIFILPLSSCTSTLFLKSLVENKCPRLSIETIQIIRNRHGHTSFFFFIVANITCCRCRNAFWKTVLRRICSTTILSLFLSLFFCVRF